MSFWWIALFITVYYMSIARACFLMKKAGSSMIQELTTMISRWSSVLEKGSWVYGEFMLSFNFFKALKIKLSYQSTNHQCLTTQILQSCSKPLLLQFNSIEWKSSFVCQVPEGFEMCVRLMLPGEIALVTCPPDYAYDKFPRLLSKI